MKVKNMVRHGLIAFLLLFLIGVGVCSGTVVSPPQQIVLQGGGEENGVWKGGYWVFTSVVDQADSFVGSISLGANTSEKFDNGTRIETRKTLEIEVTPEMAYYKRALKLMDVGDRIVSPTTYEGSLTWYGTCGYDLSKAVNAVVVKTYTWAEASWAKYTVFNVTVLLDGKEVGAARFNTEKGTKDLVVPTVNGSILIKDLGRLEGDYSEPQVPSDIVIFDNRYIYGGDAVRYVRYDHGRTTHYWGSDKSNLCYIEGSEAFSTYWYGNVRWNSNADIDDCVKDSPAPFQGPGTMGYDIADSAKGWKQDDSFGCSGRTPIAPNIFPENGSDSLIEYLNLKTSGGNIAKSWMDGYNWHLEYANGEPDAIVVSLPWGVYSGSPMVTFYVPSELVDTWVYRPAISDVHVLKAAWTNSSDICNNASCQLTLFQNSMVLSSATIQAETSERAKVFPTEETVTMQPNATLTLGFTVTNLGVSDDTSGMVSFRVLRSWDGLETDSTSLSFTLKKPVMPQNISDVVDRTGQVADRGVGMSVPEYGVPWLMILTFTCVTVVLVVAMTLVYKSRGLKKKDVQSTLFVVGKVGKQGVKEGLKLGKSLWKSSATIRAISGIFVGVGMLWLAIQPIPALLGMFGFGFFSINLLQAVLGGLGLFVIVVCISKIFR